MKWFRPSSIRCALASIFLLLFPLQWLSKVGAEINENELFTHLLSEKKATPPMHLPDGSSFVFRQSNRLLHPVIALALLLLIFSGLWLGLALPASASVTVAIITPAFWESKIVHSGLNDFYQRILRQAIVQPDGRVSSELTEANVEALIDHARLRAREAGVFVGDKTTPQSTITASAGADELDKIQLGIDGFFLSKSLKPLTAQESKDTLKGIPPFKSFRAAYVAYTGDEQVTGEKRKSRRFKESLTTADWGEVVANAMNKRMVRDYNALELNQWHDFVDVIPVGDFKEQSRVRFGGYANLATVAQGAPYMPLVSPTDEAAKYSVTKKGGTEDLTLEMIKNDDVGAVQKIPQRMARAAAQTLHEFVLDFIKPSLTTESVGSPILTYDSTALYTTAHGNKATAALAADAVAFNAARARLRKQKELDNDKPLGLRAGYLLVPSDLEAIAYGLTFPAAGNSNAVPTFAQQLGIKPIVIDYWGDATDWVLVAKREDGAGLEIGFLDGNETPETFVSDVANAGSWFTNDKLTYKIRHIYSGCITDFRFFQGSIVAG